MDEKENQDQPTDDHKVSLDANPDNKELSGQAVEANQEKSLKTTADKEMEVHHHTHPGHHKKKWTDYFWEFLMLFLAVFCGFFAEYQLEHKIERDREKQFVISLITNVKTDVDHLTKIIELRKTRVLQLDSLLYLLNADNKNEMGNSIYFNAIHVARRMNIRFTPDDGTMQQLKNAGGLRLISSRSVADSITQYDVATRNLVTIQEIEDAVIRDYQATEYKILNPLVFEIMLNENFDATRPINNPVLIPFDQAVLNEMNARLRNAKLYNKGVLRDAKAHKMQAENLLAILNKEYHLENE